MSVKDIAEKGDTEVARPGSRAGDPTLLGRKSVLMGMLTSGFVIANAAQPSAHASGTVKPSTLIATQPPPYVTTWTPSTAYKVGQQVIAPNNDVVSANVAHTSSATYGTDVAKWTPSSTFACKSTETTVVSGRLSDTSLTATYARANQRSSHMMRYTWSCPPGWPGTRWRRSHHGRLSAVRACRLPGRSHDRSRWCRSC